jgi:hypothetical protein
MCPCSRSRKLALTKVRQFLGFRKANWDRWRDPGARLVIWGYAGIVNRAARSERVNSAITKTPIGAGPFSANPLHCQDDAAEIGVEETIVANSNEYVTYAERCLAIARTISWGGIIAIRRPI